MNRNQLGTLRLWGLYPKEHTVPVPLKSLDIRIEIIHTVARVFYTQQYFNDTNLLLETEFFFPISPDACFDCFEATFNNTTIKGVVKEKEKAKEEYKEAVEQGRTAAYSEINQETGDIMKVQIGNIPPETNVSIKYSYVLKLDTMLNKFWCFRLFSTLTPRYHSGVNNLKDALSYDVDILSKYPTISGNNSEAYPWTIQTEIQSPSPITFLKSPSHDIITTYGNEKHTCLIGLNPSTRHLPNKDFVLLYTNGREGEKLDNLLTPFEEGYCAMVSMVADFEKETGEAAIVKFEQAKEIENQYSMNMIRGEYIFLLDRSGSMSGQRITMAKESLILFLMSLPKDSYFNVISFGSSYTFLHGSSVVYSQQNLDSSVAKVETFSADMGGTEIYQPLSTIFNSPPRKGYPRFIFLLTDGGVSNTQQVLDLIMANNDKARVFTVGIGNGCSPELITKGAAIGRGKHEFVIDNSQIHEKVIGLLNASLSPCYSDLSLHGDNFDAVVKSVSPNPASIPFLINGQTVTFFLFLRPEAFQDSQMRLQLRLYDSRIKKNRNLEVELDLNNTMENELIPKLAIQDMIKRLDVQKDQIGHNKEETDVIWMEKADLKQTMVEYSLKYGILCKETAFFCEVVDSEKQNVNLIPAKVVVPTPLSNDYTQAQARAQARAQAQVQAQVQARAETQARKCIHVVSRSLMQPQMSFSGTNNNSQNSYMNAQQHSQQQQQQQSMMQSMSMSPSQGMSFSGTNTNSQNSYMNASRQQTQQQSQQHRMMHNMPHSNTNLQNSYMNAPQQQSQQHNMMHSMPHSMSMSPSPGMPSSGTNTNLQSSYMNASQPQSQQLRPQQSMMQSMSMTPSQGIPSSGTNTNSQNSYMNAPQQQSQQHIQQHRMMHNMPHSNTNLQNSYMNAPQQQSQQQSQQHSQQQSQQHSQQHSMMHSMPYSMSMHPSQGMPSSGTNTNSQNSYMNASRQQTQQQSQQQSFSPAFEWHEEVKEPKMMQNKSAKPSSKMELDTLEKINYPQSYSSRTSLSQGISSALYLDIIKKQKFEGSWDPSDQVLRQTILVDSSKITPPKQIQDINSSLANIIWITVLVLRWLELVCKEDRKAWMLVYQKGCEWLKDHGVNYEEIKSLGDSNLKQEAR